MEHKRRKEKEIFAHLFPKWSNDENEVTNVRRDVEGIHHKNLISCMVTSNRCFKRA